MREALNDVRMLMEGEGSGAEERCSALHRHYQTLVRDYKRMEKRLVECQRKQLEVCWTEAKVGPIVIVCVAGWDHTRTHTVIHDV